MMYMRAYLFILLNDRFVSFGVQKVNYVVISSALFGSLTFGLGFYKMSRRVLNFLVSGGILLCSGSVFFLSFCLGRGALDACGLTAACKYSLLANIKSW